MYKALADCAVSAVIAVGVCFSASLGGSFKKKAKSKKVAGAAVFLLTSDQGEFYQDQSYFKGDLESIHVNPSPRGERDNLLSKPDVKSSRHGKLIQIERARDMI